MKHAKKCVLNQKEQFRLKPNACRLDATGPEIFYPQNAVSWQFAIDCLQDLGINMSAHEEIRTDERTIQAEADEPETPQSEPASFKK